MQRIRMLPLEKSAQKYALPIRIHASGKYLEDQAGTPFFWHGDTSWKLFWDFTLEEAETYLRDRARQGFTVIQVQLLPHRAYQANRNGDEAFLTRGDLQLPNPRYFAHVDRVLEAAKEHGVLLLVSPAWLSGWEQDWHLYYTVPNAVSFAGFLTERYGDNPQILGWIHGGDDDALELHEAVRAGAMVFKKNAPRQLNTFHAWVKGGWVFFKDEPWYDFCMAYAYSYPEFLRQIEAAQGCCPQKPLVLGETHYEGNTNIDSGILRKYAYTSVILGGAGHTYGHKDIWCKTYFWSEALCSEASHHMRALKDLFGGLPWHTLAAAQGADAVCAWGEWVEKTAYPTARMAGGGIAYLYGNVQVKLPAWAKGHALRWVDPVSGRAYAQPPAQDMVVKVPGMNAAGAEDWVLLLEEGQG